MFFEAVPLQFRPRTSFFVKPLLIHCLNAACTRNQRKKCRLASDAAFKVRPATLTIELP